jgi:putative methanogenesis marker protein 14
MGHYYTVASVELGNTTTKCIIVSTNLETAQIFQIAKEVRFTRTVRPPKKGEEVFGSTLVGTSLTKESVAELVREILLSAISKARLSLSDNLHFVVRSTGVNAGFSSPVEVDALVRALAEGCLSAGVPPRKMTASLTVDNLPPGIRDFTWLKKVYFDGAVASSLPPANTEVVANEMEGELVTAGLKGAVKGTDIDFRNPVMTLDFGTTLAGRITDDSYPYAKTIGSFAGLAGAIPDALARGSKEVSDSDGCMMDLPSMRKQAEVDETILEEILSHIHVKQIKQGTSQFGTVPVDVSAAEESGVLLFGIDVGNNGSKLGDLMKLGKVIVEEHGLPFLNTTIDHVQATLVQRLVLCADENQLILPNTSLGLTGRAITTSKKPAIVSSQLKLSNGSQWTDDHILVLVEDGLSLGAAVAARCMNSLGTRHNPMGGRKGDACIMGARMKLQNDREPTK